jgi:hypothetical protein
MTVRGPATLVCKEVVEMVSDYLGDATLSPADRARLEQHLLVCPPCTLHVAQVKSTIGHLAVLGQGPPSEVGPAIIDLFRQWKQKQGTKP